MFKYMVAAAALAFLLPGAASALTFTGNYNVSGSALSDPGLVVEIAPNPGTFSFDLDSGQSTTFNIFDIWTNEGSVGSDDRVPQGLAVNFNLLTPTGSGVLGGESVASGLIRQHGSVDWASPVQIALGNGGTLSVALSDATFNWGTFGLTPGQRNGADVFATFTYTSPSAVPLPAGLGLILAGMGAIGAAGYRRRTTDV